jgi:allantoin racemase
VRIAVVLATSGVDRDGIEDRRCYLQSVVSHDTEIVMIPNPLAPASIEDAYEMHCAAVQVTERARDVEAAGFDAAVIWCGDDPGLEAARERVCIPVVGPADASISLARQLGYRFSYISSAGSATHIERRVAAAMLSPLLASVEIVDIPVLQIRRDLRRTGDAAQHAIEAGRAKGAHTFILGCMAMYGMGRELTARFGVPVIDGGVAAILTAENLVKMGLAPSKQAFPFPPSMRRLEQQLV